MNPWLLELLIVREAATSRERRALARACEAGRLARVRPGVHVEQAGYGLLTREERHLVQVRAFASVAGVQPVSSHWSAAVLHGLPLVDAPLDRVHVVSEDASGRALVGVAVHVAPLDHGTSFVGLLHATDAARTVVDVARASIFSAAVVVADGALHGGLARYALEEAVSLAAGARGWTKAQQAVAFARAEAESAAESRSRESMMRLGVEPPVLQLEVFDERGLAGRLDFGFVRGWAGGGLDGEEKYREAGLARSGAADAVIAEKRREDRVRRRLDALARWGWRESGSTALLGPVLAAAGVRTTRPPAGGAGGLLHPVPPRRAVTRSATPDQGSPGPVSRAWSRGGQR